jgi:hypothetical protein
MNLEQNCFMVKPRHPIMKAIIDEMVNRIYNKETNIFLATGPTLVTDVFYNSMKTSTIYNVTENVSKETRRECWQTPQVMGGRFVHRCKDNAEFVFKLKGYTEDVMYNTQDYYAPNNILLQSKFYIKNAFPKFYVACSANAHQIKGLSAVIESFLNQTYAPTEIIITVEKPDNLMQKLELQDLVEKYKSNNKVIFHDVGDCGLIGNILQCVQRTQFDHNSFVVVAGDKIAEINLLMDYLYKIDDHPVIFQTVMTYTKYDGSLINIGEMNATYAVKTELFTNLELFYNVVHRDKLLTNNQEICISYYIHLLKESNIHVSKIITRSDQPQSSDVIQSLDRYTVAGNFNSCKLIRKRYHFYNRYHYGDNLMNLRFFYSIRDKLYNENKFVCYYYDPNYCKNRVELERYIDLRTMCLLPLEKLPKDANELWMRHEINNISYPNWDVYYQLFYKNICRYLELDEAKVNTSVWLDEDFLVPLYEKLPNDFKNVDILVINSQAFSNQYSQDRSILDSICVKLAKHYKIVTTLKVNDSISFTMDKKLTMQDIAAISTRAKYVITILTGPSCALYNTLSKANVKHWFFIVNDGNNYIHDGISYTHISDGKMDSIESYFLKNEASCKYVSSRGLVKSCDRNLGYTVSSDSHINLDTFRAIKEGESVYVCTSALKVFVKHCLPNLKKNIVLVTGDSDISIEFLSDVTKLLESPYIIRWFAQNCVITHPKLIHMPIGLYYHCVIYGVTDVPIAQDAQVDRLRKESRPFWERASKCYTTFHFELDRGNRKEAFDFIPKELVYYEPTKVTRDESHKHQMEYAFVLSPYGGGPDCHRTWEALCLGCIPIVKSCGLDPLFENLPVLLVKQWSDVTQELLDSTIQSFKTKTFQYEKLELQYWVNKFRQPQKLVAITVSTNYEDILSIILPQNNKFFEKWYIVTRRDDTKTLQVIADSKCTNIEVLFFDFFADGKRFNKGGAIKMAQLKLHDFLGNVLLLDSDIYLPDNFVEIYQALRIEQDTLYGASGRNDYHSFHNFRHKIVDRVFDKPDELFQGYFQLYANNSAHLYKNSYNCAECDLEFQTLFKKKMPIPGFYASHLGHNAVHWNGRVAKDDFKKK